MRADMGTDERMKHGYGVLRARLETEPDVRLAYVFGSRAEGRASAGSDWDVAVLLEREAPVGRCLELGDTLGAALETPVDVIDLRRAPIELASRVVREGVSLVERSAFERVEYEARVMACAADLAPLLERQLEEICAGGKHDRAVERYRAALGAARGLHRQA